MSVARDKFVRLAEARTRRTLRDLRLIGNLSNRSNYDWEVADVEKIFSAIEAQTKESRRRFSEARASREVEFTLD